jgi:hypothetical protein
MGLLGEKMVTSTLGATGIALEFVQIDVIPTLRRLLKWIFRLLSLPGVG